MRSSPERTGLASAQMHHVQTCPACRVVSSARPMHRTQAPTIPSNPALSLSHEHLCGWFQCSLASRPGPSPGTKVAPCSTETSVVAAIATCLTYLDRDLVLDSYDTHYKEMDGRKSKYGLITTTTRVALLNITYKCSHQVSSSMPLFLEGGCRAQSMVTPVLRV